MHNPPHPQTAKCPLHQNIRLIPLAIAAIVAPPVYPHQFAAAQTSKQNTHRQIPAAIVSLTAISSIETNPLVFPLLQWL